MSDSCSCVAWEGTEPQHVAVFSDTQFETLVREDLGDYHGAVPHRGRLRCKKCGATFAYDSSLTSTTVTRESDVVRVLAALREGKDAQVGGGRSFATYAIKDSRLIMTTSDDGYTEDIPITEERLGEVVLEHRVLFHDYLDMWKR